MSEWPVGEWVVIENGLSQTMSFRAHMALIDIDRQ